MAGILERMAMIAKANVNDLLEKFEDPAKMVDQTIADAKVEYAKVKKESLTVLAQEKQNKDKVDAELKSAAAWHNVAVSALKSGNEADARKALEKENVAKSRAEGFRPSYESSKAAADKLRSKLKDMEDEIHEMEDKAAQIKAKAVTAKAIKTSEQIASKGINRGAFDAFDRMEAKADRQLAEAEALEDLNRNVEAEDEKDLKAKYAGGGSAGTDEALDKLKAELGMN